MTVAHDQPADGHAPCGHDHRRHGGDEQQLDDAGLGERHVRTHACPSATSGGARPRRHSTTDRGSDSSRRAPQMPRRGTRRTRPCCIDARAAPASRPRPTGASRCVALLALGVIIVTGGAVRLTGSGLGCPDWPTCTHEPPRGPTRTDFHAMVEYVNRAVHRGRVGRGDPRGARLAGPRAPPARPRRGSRSGWSSAWSPRSCSAASVQLDLAPPSVIGHFLLSPLLVRHAVVLHHRAGDADGRRSAHGAPARRATAGEARRSQRRASCWSPARSSPAPGRTAATSTPSASPSSSPTWPASTASPMWLFLAVMLGRRCGALAPHGGATPARAAARRPAGRARRPGRGRLHPVLHRRARLLVGHPHRRRRRRLDRGAAVPPRPVRRARPSARRAET